MCYLTVLYELWLISQELVKLGIHSRKPFNWSVQGLMSYLKEMVNDGTVYIDRILCNPLFGNVPPDHFNVICNHTSYFVDLWIFDSLHTRKTSIKLTPWWQNIVTWIIPNVIHLTRLSSGESCISSMSSLKVTCFSAPFIELVLMIRDIRPLFWISSCKTLNSP